MNPEVIQQSGERTLRVSVWMYQSVGWFGLVFFLAMALGAGFSGETGVAVGFLFFVLISFPILLLSGPISISASGMDVLTRSGRYSMKWNEVDRIETGASMMVLFADRRRLCIPLSKFWSGVDREPTLLLFQLILDELQIEMKPSIRADYLFPKGTRVPL